MEINDQNIDPNHIEQEIPVQEDSKSSAQESSFVWTTKTTIVVIFILFISMVFYIYNSLHVAKAIKHREELKTSLKEFHSERISLESEITKASKQTQIAEKLRANGLQEITTPPIKITRDPKK
jgi:cell division protein FtsL